MPIVESIRTSQADWKPVPVEKLEVPFNPEDPEGPKVTLNIIDKKLLSCLKRIYEN